MAIENNPETVATLDEMAEHGIVLIMDGGVIHSATVNGKDVPVTVIVHDYDVDGVDEDDHEVFRDADGDEYIIVEIA